MKKLIARFRKRKVKDFVGASLDWIVLDDDTEHKHEMWEEWAKIAKARSATAL